MAEQRGYQYDFAASSVTTHDTEGRLRKAATMVAVLSDYFDVPLQELRVLDVGSSTGIIDDHLAEHVHSVLGIDIDKPAIESAQKTFHRDNLAFREGDALATQLPDASVDVVICSHVYEHVPDASAMMDEIFRVLRPGGVCYFAAGNRFMWNEPHYNLPLLSAIPRPLAHLYIRLAGKASHYHELHFSYWGLRNLTRRFDLIDYTAEIIEHPDKFGTAYMIPPGSRKQAIARLIAKRAFWLVPGYIWLLRKPGVFATQEDDAADPMSAKLGR
ncbi:MAG: class I SAM-dependent methyltransferase [Acidobacteria bacterium]|nr:class I SAM-dependent methyltransferase [Acidobacteriota bacterium]